MFQIDITFLKWRLKMIFPLSDVENKTNYRNTKYTSRRTHHLSYDVQDFERIGRVRNLHQLSFLKYFNTQHSICKGEKNQFSSLKVSMLPLP